MLLRHSIFSVISLTSVFQRFSSMAWQCDSESNVGLVANLKDAGIISSKEVESAMLAVDRRNYAPSNPYQDSPQYLGYVIALPPC